MGGDIGRSNHGVGADAVNFPGLELHDELGELLELNDFVFIGQVGRDGFLYGAGLDAQRGAGHVLGGDILVGILGTDNDNLLIVEKDVGEVDRLGALFIGGKAGHD